MQKPFSALLVDDAITHAIKNPIVLNLDQKIIDGTSHLTHYVSTKLRKTQSGIIQNYLLGVLAVLVVFIIVINQL